MVKQPVLSGKAAIKLLYNKGFVLAGQKGSHVKLKGIRNKKKRIVIVPLHKELAPGTLASILRQADITIEELMSEKE